MVDTDTLSYVNYRIDASRIFFANLYYFVFIFINKVCFYGVLGQGHKCFTNKIFNKMCLDVYKRQEWQREIIINNALRRDTARGNSISNVERKNKSCTAVCTGRSTEIKSFLPAEPLRYSAFGR